MYRAAVVGNAVLLFHCLQGAKLDAEAALQVVEMYINTRGVGLAEAFVQRWTEENGVKPNRR